MNLTTTKRQLLSVGLSLAMALSLVPATAFAAEPAVPELTDGKYTAVATMKHEIRDQPSMCDIMFDANVDIEVKGDNAAMTFLVANPVPGFPDQGADGTVKNAVISYNGQQYPMESQLGTDAKMTAKNSNPAFGLETGKQYAAQVLTVTLPKAALTAAEPLVTNCYVNVVMNTDVVFRIALSDLKRTGDLDPVVPEVTDGKYTAVAAMLHENKNQPSMCDIMFDANVDIEVKGDNAAMTFLVANPVPGFPDQGADGTVKNAVINYNGQQYPMESQLGTDAKMTAKNSNPAFGLETGKQYAAQVLTVTLPKAALTAAEPLVTNCYVNVVMNTDVVFRIALNGLKRTGDLDPEVDPEPASPVKVEKLGNGGLGIKARISTTDQRGYFLIQVTSKEKSNSIYVVKVANTENGAMDISYENGGRITVWQTAEAPELAVPDGSNAGGELLGSAVL